jgi:hypothetical protein
MFPNGSAAGASSPTGSNTTTNTMGGWANVNYSDPNYWQNWNTTIGGLGSALGQWYTAFGGTGGSSPQVQQQQQYQYQQEQQKKDRNNLIIFGSIGLIALALILFFVLRKK